MAGRHWDARFENDHLVIRRRRWLPWRKADVRHIPLGTVLEIDSPTAADHAKRRARLTVQDPSAPHLTELIAVRFTPEQWELAGGFRRERRPAPTEQPQPGEEASPEPAAPPRPVVDVPGQAQRRAQGTVAPQAKPPAQRPFTTRSGPWTTPAMRAGDGKRPVWLWPQDGKIHASLVPVGKVAPRRLSAADVAHLLLADPSRAMPAIRTLTGITDSQQALARLRSWRRSDRAAVHLSASDLAGQRVTEAMQKPGRSNPDGSVRTVSGGLPSLNKRRR